MGICTEAASNFVLERAALPTIIIEIGYSLWTSRFLSPEGGGFKDGYTAANRTISSPKQ